MGVVLEVAYTQHSNGNIKAFSVNPGDESVEDTNNTGLWYDHLYEKTKYNDWEQEKNDSFHLPYSVFLFKVSLQETAGGDSDGG